MNGWVVVAILLSGVATVINTALLVYRIRKGSDR